MIQKEIRPKTEPEVVYVLVKNGSSGALASGDVVVWDNTDLDGMTVDTTTTASDTTVAGVMADTVAVGAYGRMQIYGYHSAVKVDGGTTDVAAFAVLGTQSVAKKAYTTTAVGSVLGIALEAVTTDTTAKVFIKCR